MPSLRGLSMSNLLIRGQMADSLKFIDVIIKIGLCQGKSRLQELVRVDQEFSRVECLTKIFVIWNIHRSFESLKNSVASKT
jgi:hypothetical protein